MNKFILAFLISIFAFTSVEAKTICGSYYPGYGMLNIMNADGTVNYHLNYPGVIIGAIFFPTIIIPAYVLGFDLMRPGGLKPGITCKDLYGVKK